MTNYREVLRLSSLGLNKVEIWEFSSLLTNTRPSALKTPAKELCHIRPDRL